MPQPDDATARLHAERDKTAAQLQLLRRDFAGMVEASKQSNADDEHDPEGSTIAFERSQVGALIAQAEQRLMDIEEALDRVENGTYGVCANCGRPIAAERLAARPTARTCVDCT